VVCVCGGRKCNHPRLLLEKQRKPAVPLRVAFVNANLSFQLISTRV
jgi:hypothetical protein